MSPSACVGADFAYEVVADEIWHGRRMVSDKLRDRPMSICCDAAHDSIPFAGYGMNAGIADCTNLSWQLAANFSGWAGEDLLDAHEAERHPITQQVSLHIMDLTKDSMAL